ncbi:MAG: thioredoxin family protein [Desulfuromonadales bacterium]|nr:thioredoxin family protein [Desulfuromonadales bacterium]
MRFDIICKPETGARAEQSLTNVQQALREMGVQAEVHLFRDRRKMVDHRVYVAPALLVDDVVRVAGRVPEVDEIKSFIAERPRYLQTVADVA